MFMFTRDINLSNNFDPKEQVVLYYGGCLELLKQIPDKKIQLIVTSPPTTLAKNMKRN